MSKPFWVWYLTTMIEDEQRRTKSSCAKVLNTEHILNIHQPKCWTHARENGCQVLRISMRWPVCMFLDQYQEESKDSSQQEWSLVVHASLIPCVCNNLNPTWHALDPPLSLSASKTHPFQFSGKEFMCIVMQVPDLGFLILIVRRIDECCWQSYRDGLEFVQVPICGFGHELQGAQWIQREEKQQQMNWPYSLFDSSSISTILATLINHDF